MAIVSSTETVGEAQVPVLIEVEHAPATAQQDVYRDARSGKSEKVLDAAGGLFNQGLDLARTCALQAVETIGNVTGAAAPDEFEVALAIKLDAEVGAVLAKTAAGAQLQVTMKWRPGA